MSLAAHCRMFGRYNAGANDRGYQAERLGPEQTAPTGTPSSSWFVARCVIRWSLTGSGNSVIAARLMPC